MADGEFSIEAAEAWAGDKRSLFGNFAGDATVALKLEGAPQGKVNVTLTIERGDLIAAAKGAAKGADVTLSGDHDVMVALLACDDDPAQRYMNGGLKAEGDMALWFELLAAWHAAC